MVQKNWEELQVLMSKEILMGVLHKEGQEINVAV